MEFKQNHFYLALALLSLPLFGWVFWQASLPETLPQALAPFEAVGDKVEENLSAMNVISPVQAGDGYSIEDKTKPGIDISSPGKSAEEAPAVAGYTLSLPEDIGKEPLSVKLPSGDSFAMRSLEGQSYTSSVVSGESLAGAEDDASILSRLFPKREGKYLRYESEDNRKALYYVYQADQATGEKRLKHWTLYRSGDGDEEERYAFEDARLKKNEDGTVSVFYFSTADLRQNEQAAGVESSLLDRAARVLAKDAEEDIMNGGRMPDAIIPAPFVLDRDGKQMDLSWQVEDEGKVLKVAWKIASDKYPIALDPTLAFTAPGQSNSGGVINGETVGSSFGETIVSGDFNADGKMDLAVAGRNYSSDAGRVYFFYNDSTTPLSASGADAIITGEASSKFGGALTSGDFNADGKIDLGVGANAYNSNAGRAYIFYNDGQWPVNAASADVIITGTEFFASRVIAGDLNADGKTDFVATTHVINSGQGAAYIFYNDGSIPTTAGTADVTITGNASNDAFGISVFVGDFDSSGTTDLVVGGYGYSTNTGRAYIFYNDGSIPTTAGTADVTITGNASGDRFGTWFAAGDFNTDGRIDLAVTAVTYSSNTGRAYIFYNDGSIPTTAGTADVTITGESTGDLFGDIVVAGDFNADGKTDLAIGGRGYTTDTGRTHIFYNDGSIPTTAATADVIITGETTTNYFGFALAAGDFNNDSRTDLAIGAYGHLSSTGRVYIFYSQNGQVNTNTLLVGNATSDAFGRTLATGDVNIDGRTDLLVGAPGYSSFTGRVYIFYGDGQLPAGAATADVTITGAATGDNFGQAIVTGDLNADGEVDLAVGAYGHSSSTGRAYIFHNDGSIPTTAGTADVTITGAATGDNFGYALSTGDLNADGEVDLAVGAYGHSTSTGRAYIFHNDGSIPTTAGTADVTITGNATGDNFGITLVVGDLNSNGRVDLAVGATGYSTSTGRAYIFHNDGSIPTTAGTADVTIDGNATGDVFGTALAVGDFNSDLDVDLAVGASGYSTSTGRVYLFHNDGSVPTTAATADVTITGGATSDLFGTALASDDFNADSRVDLAVGASGYSSSLGRAYIFHNDGSIPTTAGTADVTISGNVSSGDYGAALATGDMNGDGRIDLWVGAYGESTDTGQVYLYETRENFAWKLQTNFIPANPRTSSTAAGQEMRITGETGTTGQFGNSFATGDLNSDGRLDLIVAATNVSTNTGRLYVFYADVALPSTATNADVIITGETTSNFFSSSIATGDFNNDGKIDLVAGALGYSSNTGRTYIFYNDGAYPSAAGSADVIITGNATSDQFGGMAVTGDFNYDGTTDLLVGAAGYSTNTGRAYLFYNDGSIPTTAGSADVTITGAAGSDSFGGQAAVGDFNSDNRSDFIIGAFGVASSTGAAYIFHNDGSIPTTAGTADVTISGQNTGDLFGTHFAIGDFNNDSRMDIAIPARAYNGSQGRAYLFYNDGSIPTAAGSADLIITGAAASTEFGYRLASGDFNGDGRIDLAVSARAYTTNTGRVHVFYNDGSAPTYPTGASSADIILTGENTSDRFGSSLITWDANLDGRVDLVVDSASFNSSQGRMYVYTINDTVLTGAATSDRFGFTLAGGDFNSDGRTDLAVGAWGHSSSTGRAYLFYNDTTFPTTVATADVTITGNATGDNFGRTLAAGDLNADGRTDLIAGAQAYSTSTGRAYIFYNDGSIPTTAGTADVTITGNATNDLFGAALATGDLNADGETDLVIGAYGHSSSTGRAYIFHGDGSIPTTAGTADVTITGNATSDQFGWALAVGDFNTDGEVDLISSAPGYLSSTGRAYIFHNDGSIPTTAGTADVTITGTNGSDLFGYAIGVGDFDTSGTTDFMIGEPGFSGSTGRATLFLNDGSLPTASNDADRIIFGVASSGEKFGATIIAGDWNGDKRSDIIVGAWETSTVLDHVYIFLNDGLIPTSASSADMTLTGENTTDDFGIALASGDFNSDGNIDLAVGAQAYSSNTGRVYNLMSDVSPNTPEAAKVKGMVKMKGTIKVK